MDDSPDRRDDTTAESREALLTRTLVTLADSVVAEADAAELLQTLADQSVALLDAVAAGIVLRSGGSGSAGSGTGGGPGTAGAGTEGSGLEIAASTSGQSRQVELDEVRLDEGPCIDAIRTGEVVSASSPAEIEARWPAVAASITGAGFASAHAIPLRLREQTIGALNLFRDVPGSLPSEDAIAAQALADVATIGILHERTISDSSVVRAQLEHALSSRIVIEQAKGALSHVHDVDVDVAFQLLRAHARSTGTKLSVVAAGVVDGTVQVERQR